MASPKSCAILGHNPMRFAWGFDEEAAECHDMKMELAQQIMVLRQQGVTHFSVACDYGVGLYAAEIINALRNDDSELMLFCITPYEEQATKWTPALRERYFDMLIKCTHMTAVSLHKQPDAQLEAYRAIIRQALVERYPREKFQLATKNAAWINCKTREEATAQFDTSLKQTGAGYFDFYL